MGLEKNAKLTVGVEGDDRAVAAAKKVKGAWEDIKGGLKQVDAAALGAGGALVAAAYGAARLATDVAKAATGVKAIDFNAAVQGARSFDETVTRMAIRGGKNVEQLGERFRVIGKDVKGGAEQVANVTRQLGALTLSPDAVDAMQALKDEANDTDRSLEEMVGLGDTLYSRLGVPMNRVGDAIGKIKSVAEDLQTVGGSMALERTLQRLAPLLAKFGGGVERAAATVAVIGKGLAPQQADEVAGGVMNTMAAFDPLLVIKKLRQMKGKDYQPYERDAQGMLRYKQEVPKLLQAAFKKSPNPYGAALRAAGGDVNVAERFLGTSWDEVAYNEEGPARARARAAGLGEAGAIDLNDFKPSDTRFVNKAYREALNKGEAPSVFSESRSAARIEADNERANAEKEVGDKLLQMRDKRDAAYKGRAKLRIGEETVSSYIPGLGTAYTLGSAAAAATTSSGGPPPTINLSSQSVQDLARTLRETPLQVKPPATPPPPAKQNPPANE